MKLDVPDVLLAAASIIVWLGMLIGLALYSYFFSTCQTP